jgi:hypothetical protein
MFKKSSTFLSILDGDWKSNLLLLKQIMQPIKTAETHKKKQFFFIIHMQYLPSLF